MTFEVVNSTKKRPHNAEYQLDFHFMLLWRWILQTLVIPTFPSYWMHCHWICFNIFKKVNGIRIVVAKCQRLSMVDDIDLRSLGLNLPPPVSSIILISTCRRDWSSHSLWHLTAQQHRRFSSHCLLALAFLFCFPLFLPSENLPSRQTHPLAPLCQPCETGVWLDDAELSLLCSP